MNKTISIPGENETISIPGENETISIPGEFVLGLKPQSGLEESIEAAKKEGTDIGIIIDDTGFKERREYYHRFGEEGITSLYDEWKKHHKEKACQGIACGMSEAPTVSEDDIDFSQYKLVKGRPTKNARDVLVEKILEKCNINPSKIIYETDLIRFASDKMSGGSKWKKSSLYVPGERDQLGLEFVRTQNKMPSCQGVYIALFEKLSEKYNQVNLHFTESMKTSAIAGIINYKYLSKKSKGYEWKTLTMIRENYGK